MKILTFLVFALALPGLGQDDGAARKERLERFRKLSPEQKLQLREKVNHLRSLPAEERDRLRENFARLQRLSPEDRARLRERMDKVNPRERRELGELAGGFFRWSKQQGFGRAFPRDQFFAWLQGAKREDLEKLRAMEPMGRRDAFVKLFYEFRDRSLERIAEDNEKHAFLDPAELQGLRDASITEFWPKLDDCRRRRHGRGPGPVPPRPHGPRPSR